MSQTVFLEFDPGEKVWAVVPPSDDFPEYCIRQGVLNMVIVKVTTSVLVEYHVRLEKDVGTTILTEALFAFTNLVGAQAFLTTKLLA